LPDAAAPPGAESPGDGRFVVPAYTPAVRRWVCIVAMLAGFSGSGYAWTARTRIAVPMVRVLDPRRPEPGLPEVAWWNLS
jgi:hypothetical protein